MHEMRQDHAQGDKPLKTKSGHGIDVAIQREDFLDGSAITQIRSLVAERGTARALDAACAAGGQARRMARAGAAVTAVDLHSDGAALLRAVAEEGLTQIDFLQADLRNPELYQRLGQFDLIVAQRFIHYLPFRDAVEVMRFFHDALRPEGKLYISASGIRSELGQHYDGEENLAKRFAALWPPMAAKHGIHGKVCLHEEKDMRALLAAGGMHAEKLYASPFGNLKCIACPD
jgi:2-polyprenyl-3-methyl-5-hydroxy-6-metoxy-1,4-benzoquinol methylase